MRALADTSVLVAALLKHHSNHSWAVSWFAAQEAGEVELFVCQHSLAELFPVLTGSPAPIKIEPSTAAQLISGLRVDVVELGRSHYDQAIARLSAAGLAGGVVYDMLQLIAAEACEADQLVTANKKGFDRLPFARAIEIVST